MGVAIVQIEQVRAPVSSSSELGDQNPRLGLLAILAACVSSGLAGGWFEYILKAPAPISDSDVPDSNPSTPSSATSLLSHSSVSTPTSPSSKSPTRRVPREMVLRDNSPSLWARNLQLSVPSLCFSLAGVFLSPERNLLLKYGPLQGFNPLVWSVVVNQAAGGLLVAMVVREADGVAKGFATSIAIVGKLLFCAVLSHPTTMQADSLSNFDNSFDGGKRDILWTDSRIIIPFGSFTSYDFYRNVCKV